MLNHFGLSLEVLVANDTGVLPPVFKSDILLRGGQWEAQFYNTSATNDVRIKVWIVQTGNNPDFAFEPILPALSWDPSVSPDFIKEIGKPIHAREVTLEQGNSYTMKGRYRMQKIDQIANASQSFFYCFICVVM